MFNLFLPYMLYPPFKLASNHKKQLLWLAWTALAGNLTIQLAVKIKKHNFFSLVNQF